MSQMARFGFLGLAIAMVVAAGSWAAAQDGAGKKVVVGLVQIDLQHPFHIGEVEGAKEAARRYGAEIKIVSGEGDVGKQVQAFESLINQKVQAISVNCIDVKAFAPAFAKAKAAGIPVVILHSKSDMAASFVGFDERATGNSVGEYSVKLLTEKYGKPKGEVAILQGMLGQGLNADRTGGFTDIMAKYPDIKVVAQEPTNWDPVKAVQITENYMTAYPNLDLIYGCSDGLTVPAADAIEKAGRKIIITSVDGSDYALEAIKNNKIASTFLYASQYAGYMKAKVPILLAQGKPAQTEYLIKGVLVNKDNVDGIFKLVAAMKDDITNFDFEKTLPELIHQYSK